MAWKLTEEAWDRRSRHRFEFSYELQYRAVGQRAKESGHGQSINLSSNGLLFTSEHILDVGMTVEADLQWPIKLDNRVALKLAVVGTIVRVESGNPMKAAMRIDRYELRISSAV